MILFYKIFHKISPSYLHAHIPPLREHTYSYQSPNTLHLIKCCTNKYMNSFFPSCTKIWNDIGDDLGNCDTDFPWYAIHEKLFLIFMTQLV